MKPRATICPHCRYSNGGVFSVCPICKREVVHIGDRLNGLIAGAIIAGAIVATLIERIA